MVPDEYVSQPTVEQALGGWVLAGSGPHSMANPKFWEVCATQVCAAVLRVEPPPCLELLSRRLQVTAQPVLRLPTEAVGQGSQRGMHMITRPLGPAQAPCKALMAILSVPPAGWPGVANTPGSCSGGDMTLSAAQMAGAVSSTQGQDRLLALLVHRNEGPQDSRMGEAQKLHLHLATGLDLPPEFPKSNLRSQYTALGRLPPARFKLDQLVLQFVPDRPSALAAPQDPAPDSEEPARVAADSRADQARRSGKSPSKGKDGPHYDSYSVAVMFCWHINLHNSPETIYTVTPGRLGMVLKKGFRDFRVSYIKDEGQQYHTKVRGSALVDMRPESAPALERNGGATDNQFSYEWSKANKQPDTGGLLLPLSFGEEQHRPPTPLEWRPHGGLKRGHPDLRPGWGRGRRPEATPVPLRISPTGVAPVGG